MLDKYFTTSLNYFRTLNEETFFFLRPPLSLSPPPRARARGGCFATVMDTE